jgi:hypothetical protein
MDLDFTRILTPDLRIFILDYLFEEDRNAWGNLRLSGHVWNDLIPSKALVEKLARERNLRMCLYQVNRSSTEPQLKLGQKPYPPKFEKKKNRHLTKSQIRLGGKRCLAELGNSCCIICESNKPEDNPTRILYYGPKILQNDELSYLISAHKPATFNSLHRRYAVRISLV